MITMAGKLITLEPMNTEEHAQGYFELSQDTLIHRYTGNTVPRNPDEIIALLKKYEVYFMNWMIISNATRQVIGIIRLGKPEMDNGILSAGESEFLSSQYWRKGHMKEAKTLFYQYVFDELGVDTLYADVWEGNTNSLKSLEYYGYKLIDTVEGVFPKTGKPMKKYILSLSKADYQLRCREEYHAETD